MEEGCHVFRSKSRLKGLAMSYVKKSEAESEEKETFWSLGLRFRLRFMIPTGQEGSFPSGSDAASDPSPLSVNQP